MHTLTNRHPAILAVLPAGYQRLFDRTVEVLAGDERVRALWLSGSLARGTADAASDLDLLLAVADEEHERFEAEWRTWLAAITPTLIARPLAFAPGSFYSVTPGRERLDVVVEAVSRIASTPFRTRLTVFDRDGLDDLVPRPGPPAGPEPTKVAALVEEFFRDYGMFDVVVRREDWLLGLEAVHFLRTLLYQLFVVTNAPLPAMGVKQWSTKLTRDQRAALLALPTGGATPEEIVGAHEAVATAFVTRARAICADHGVAWPDELESATCAHLSRLGLPALQGAKRSG